MFSMEDCGRHGRLSFLEELYNGHSWDADPVDNISMDLTMESGTTDLDGDYEYDGELSQSSCVSMSSSSSRKRGRERKHFDIAVSSAVPFRTDCYESPPLSPVKDGDHKSSGNSDMSMHRLQHDDDEAYEDDEDCFFDLGSSHSLTSLESFSSSSMQNEVGSKSRYPAHPALKSLKISRPKPEQDAFDEAMATDRTSASDTGLFMSPCPPTPGLRRKHSTCRSTGRGKRSSSITGDMRGGDQRARACSEGDVFSFLQPRSRRVGRFSEICAEDALEIPLEVTRAFCRCDNKTCDEVVSFRDDFSMKDLIGKGVFAEVYSVVDRKGQMSLTNFSAAGTTYAIKKLLHPFFSCKEREEQLKEPRIMFQLKQRSCPFIIDFVMAWQENECLYMQFEFASKGSLSGMLALFKAPRTVISHSVIPESFIYQVAHNVCSAVVHIHSHGYVHLDIKPANLLICSSGLIKIGDFGKAVKAGMGEDGQEGDQR
jgi:hypothetical protein